MNQPGVRHRFTLLRLVDHSLQRTKHSNTHSTVAGTLRSYNLRVSCHSIHLTSVSEYFVRISVWIDCMPSSGWDNLDLDRSLIRSDQSEHLSPVAAGIHRAVQYKSHMPLSTQWWKKWREEAVCSWLLVIKFSLFRTHIFPTSSSGILNIH